MRYYKMQFDDAEKGKHSIIAKCEKKAMPDEVINIIALSWGEMTIREMRRSLKSCMPLTEEEAEDSGLPIVDCKNAEKIMKSQEHHNETRENQDSLAKLIEFPGSARQKKDKRRSDDKDKQDFQIPKLGEFREKMYDRYRMNWMMWNEFRIEDLLQQVSMYMQSSRTFDWKRAFDAWQEESGFDGDIWLPYKQFMRDIYTDFECMAEIMDDEEIVTWKFDMDAGGHKG